MARNNPVRAADETMLEFVERRTRELRSDAREAEAVARYAYGKAIRGGKDVVLRTEADLRRHGAQLLNAATRSEPGRRAVDFVAHATGRQAKPQLVKPKAASPKVAPAERLQPKPSLTGLAAAGSLARRAGNVAGMVEGGVKAAGGLVEGAAFVQRLANPFDPFLSAPGHSAAEDAWRAGIDAGLTGIDYIQKGVADPKRIVRDVQTKVHDIRVDLDPTATPMGATLPAEVQRSFDIGRNQGEAAVGIASTLVGGPLAKSIKGIPRVSGPALTEKYIKEGFSPGLAAYLAEPYPASGMGHHTVGRRVRLPALLGGGPLPKSYSDGPFNRFAPEGISRGDMYQEHYEVDTHFQGARLPKRFAGERWSGKALGLKKRGPVGRVWHGSPAPLKARVGGGAVSLGGALYDDHPMDDQP